MEEGRYRSIGAGRNLEIVTVRSLSENNIFSVRSHSSYDRSPIRSRPDKSKKSSSLTVKNWWNDPEMKRRRRVAKYKLYSAEGKVKTSFKKGFRWVKKKCVMLVRRL